MSKLLSTEKRVSPIDIFSHIVNEWEKIKSQNGNRGNGSYETPSWRFCILRHVVAMADGGFYLKLWDTRLNQIREIEIRGGDDYRIGARELEKAGIFKNNGNFFIDDMVHFILIETAIATGLIAEERTEAPMVAPFGL